MLINDLRKSVKTNSSSKMNSISKINCNIANTWEWKCCVTLVLFVRWFKIPRPQYCAWMPVVLVCIVFEQSVNSPRLSFSSYRLLSASIYIDSMVSLYISQTTARLSFNVGPVTKSEAECLKHWHSQENIWGGLDLNWIWLHFPTVLVFLTLRNSFGGLNP